MSNKILSLLTLICISGAVFSQNTIEVEVSRKAINPALLELQKDKKEIRDDFILNERLLDLVNVWETDSIITKKRERHRVFGAAIIPLFGYRWAPVTFRKEKYVGTVKGEIRVSGEERFTEYDINFNMVPHLPQYIALAYVGHIMEKRYGRQKNINKVNKAPYVYPKNEQELEELHLHNECTPSRDHRALLDSFFYPVIRPSNLKTHNNFGEEGVTLGMYGPLVSDCNHKCHPEIHPYEWIWWMDLNPNREHTANSSSWYIGLLRDVSNRMKHWSSAPRTGQISIPFVFPADAKDYTISIEHILYDVLYADKLAQRIQLPEAATDLNFEELVVSLKGLGKNLTIKTDEKIDSEGIKLWITDVILDEKENLVSGYLNIALSVQNVYTAKVTTSFN